MVHRSLQIKNYMLDWIKLEDFSHNLNEKGDKKYKELNRIPNCGEVSYVFKTR